MTDEPKIDAHMHLGGPRRRWGAWSDDDALEAADRLGIELLCISNPAAGNANPDPATVRELNDDAWATQQRYPDRVRCYAYLNPGYHREGLEEARRCLDRGYIGFKFYHQYLADEPVLFPFYELAIEAGAAMLWHAGRPWQNKLYSDQPRITDAGDLVRASQRYPEAIFIEGHIGGGGDWEWALRELREAPGVYLDTSGSVVDDGIVDRCVELLGVDRLLFATDMTMEGGVGKVMDARLTAAERARIYRGNMQAILDRRVWR